MKRKRPKEEELPKDDVLSLSLLDNWEKTSEIDALRLLVDISSNLTEEHVSRLLGLYSASLSESDQIILQILRKLEENGIKFAKFSPIIWGNSAAQKYSDLKTLGPSLWNRPSCDQVLDVIDPQILWKSILSLPLELSLIQESDKTINGNFYDPRFLLPVFASLTVAENEFSCRKFVDLNCLAYTFACLSCHDKELRKFAYLVLWQFLYHLKSVAVTSENFPEKSQFIYLLTLLKNSTEAKNQRICCVLSHFLSRVSKLLLHPEDSVYSQMNTFLLMKPTLDLENVPEFYKLFNSSSTEHFERERQWILQLIAEGLREPIDYHIIEKRHGFKLMLSFFDCPFSEQRSRSLILRTIKAACSLDTPSSELLRKSNLIGWICSTVTSDRTTQWELGFLADILIISWEKNKTKMTDLMKASFIICASLIKTSCGGRNRDFMHKLDEIQ